MKLQLLRPGKEIPPQTHLFFQIWPVADFPARHRITLPQIWIYMTTAFVIRVRRITCAQVVTACRMAVFTMGIYLSWTVPKGHITAISLWPACRENLRSNGSC